MWEGEKVRESKRKGGRGRKREAELRGRSGRESKK